MAWVSDDAPVQIVVLDAPLLFFALVNLNPRVTRGRVRDVCTARGVAHGGQKVHG